MSFKKIIFLLVIIILSALFLRFYQLDKYPIQLNHDEVSQIYDTESIVQTKRDIYGNFLPFAFPSTGDFKPGHYIYISILPYLIFGDQETTIRIPAAFFGTLTILAVFSFVFFLTKNSKLSLLSAALVSITPSEIYYSRKSFENIIGECLLLSGASFLLKTLKTSNNKFSWGCLSALFFALAMYIYTSYPIIVPLLIISFAIIFKNEIRPLSKKYITILSVWVICIIPLIYLTMNNPDVRFRAGSVFITADINFGKQLNYLETNNQLQLFFYKYKTLLDLSFDKYLKQFDPTRIFLNGLDFTNQGPLGMGPLLLIQLPFFILGLLYSIKKQNFAKEKRFLLVFLAIAMIPSAITFENFSPHRSVLAFTLLSIISAFGIFYFLDLIKKHKNYIKISLLSFLMILFVVNFIYFIQMYTIHLPFEKSQQIHYPFKDVALFSWSEHDNFNQIIFDPIYGESAPVRGVAAHYYLAYYGKYPPKKFQEEYKKGSKEGEMVFDKFSIRKVDWREDQNLKSTLIIASPWDLPIKDIDKNKIIKTFYFYDHEPAFYAIKL